MAAKPVENWIASTVRIENEKGHLGTGFLLARSVSQGKFRIFLVTNKHIIHKTSEGRCKASIVKLHVNRKIGDRSIKKDVISFALPADKSLVWREHPEKDTDVMAIDVTKIFVEIKNIKSTLIPFEEGLATKELIAKHEISAGDDVLIIGYPDISPMIVSYGDTNYPFVRYGIMASQIGFRIKDVQGKRERELRGFLVDGGIIPGSSGSPVILKPVAGRIVGGKSELGTPPTLLLGIAAEERHYRRDGEKRLPANMGFAFEAETIKEVIDMFFCEK